MVEVDYLPETASKALERESLSDSLTAEFAIYLEQYGKVSIEVNGTKLNPSALQENRAEYELAVPDVSQKVLLVVIEWKRAVDRAIYMCNADGMALGETKPAIQAPDFDFTAYIKWDGFSGHNFLLAELGAKPLSDVLEAARVKLREHFKQQANQKRRAVIEDWVREGVYPYLTPPTDPVKKAEREAFEVVAYAAATSINGGDSPSRKLSLRLLKEALESNPGSLHGVLQGVLDLPKEKLEELGGLLNQTSLSSIIATSKIVSDRLSFLSGIDSIIFDPDSKRQTLERRQLHRILVNETWIFGEEWALTGDDEPLSKVLKNYLSFLGDDVELADVKPVFRHDGTKPIPDLVLSRTRENSQDHTDNLVVELKRPNVIIGDDEMSQITKYALAVTRDDRFNRENVKWVFWVIGNHMDELAEDRRNQVGLPHGCIHRTVKHEVYAMTWAEVLNSAKHRLKFVEKTLQFSATHDDGVKYLQKTHAKYLPPVLAVDEKSQGAVVVDEAEKSTTEDVA